jgi:hypothetical protein
MRTLAVVCAALVFLSIPSSHATAQEIPMLKRMTPILTVEAIEPSLLFWMEGLGFEKTNEVPQEDGTLGFVSLEREGIELMLQTRASVAADLPALAEEFARGPSVLFMEIDSLEGMEEKLLSLGGSIARPRRQTFYGADEIFFYSPGGHVVGLAVFGGGGS